MKKAIPIIFFALFALSMFWLVSSLMKQAYKQGAIDQRNAKIFVWDGEIWPADSLLTMCKYRPGDTLVFDIPNCESCCIDTIVVDSIRLGAVYQECRYMSNFHNYSEEALRPLEK